MPFVTDVPGPKTLIEPVCCSPMPKAETGPKKGLPEDLEGLPGLIAAELYAYRAVEKGLSKLFYSDYVEAHRKKYGREHVKFSLHHVVLFFFKAAAEGIIGNAAYTTVAKIVEALRKPKREVFSSRAQFKAVVSRRTYNRIRREHHPGTKPSRAISPKLEEKLETDYRLIVTFTKTRR
jgi:hypothetical protein